MVSNEEIKKALNNKRTGKQVEDVFRCPECGVENLRSSSYCSECGADLYPRLNERKDDISREIGFMGLSPAESMILLDNKTNSRELVKVTFLDMLNRKVIGIQSRGVMKGLINKKEKMENFVEGGDAFMETLKPHEEVFQKALGKNEELTLKKYTKNLVRKLGMHTSSSSNRKGDFPRYRSKKLLEPMTEAGYLEKVKGGFLSRTKYTTTDYGVELRNKLENLLSEAENLDKYVSTDPQKAKVLVNVLGTHIFLLKQFDAGKLREFNKELSNVRIEKDDNTLLLMNQMMLMDYGQTNIDNTSSLSLSNDFNIIDSMDSSFMDAIDSISDSIDQASSDLSSNGGDF